MASTGTATDGAVNIVRWLARIAGVVFVLATVVTDVIVVGEFLGGGPNWAALSAAQIMALIFALGIPIIQIVGVALAWRWEGVGGAIILAAAAFSFVANAVSGELAMALTAAPIALVGAAFLYCWWRERAAPSPGRDRPRHATGV